MENAVDNIVQQYLDRVRIKDDFISAACPFHKGGKETNPSFWVNRITGHWGCFTCGEKGGGLKWLLRRLGINSLTMGAQLDAIEEQSAKLVEVTKSKAKKKSRGSFAGVHVLPDSLLGVFDFLPLDLLEAGFTDETLKSHDIGFDKRNNRITFPIRDLYGALIGISGRSTTVGEVPKYLVYSGRRIVDGKEDQRELGEWYPDYSNENVRDHLWRLDKCFSRIMANESGQEELVIVEGYKADLWLAQHGWTNTVALMGSALSPNQERIVRNLGVPTFVFLDNNKPGRDGSRRICQRLAVSTFPVYEVSYPEGCKDTAQPDDLTTEEIEAAFAASRRVGSHDRKSL
jgi:DNA primase